MTDETLKQHNDAVLNAIAELSKKIDDVTSRLDTFVNLTNAQLEAIRSGLVANHSEFSRLTAKVWNMTADLNDLTEEIRKDKLALK